MPLSPYRVLKHFKYAVYFDGIDDYVEIVSSSLALRNFTVLAWFRVTGFITDPYYGTLVARGDFSVGRSDNYQLRISRGTYYPVVRVGGGQPGLLYELSYSYNCFDGKIHMLGASAEYTTATALKMYLDGSLVATTTLSYPPYVNPDYRTRIGRWGAQYFPGYIYRALIYSRALSNSEVQWNYQYPDNPVRNGLVLWLQADPAYIKDIDGDGVLEWVDLSGFGNHGKIYGAQLVQLTKTPTRTITPYRVSSPKRVLEAVR